MKNAIIRCLVLLGASALVLGCYNQPSTFADWDEKTIYFPYQYPVRTLSLGKDVIDNSLDRQHKFNIGVVVGGYYKVNKQDWRVDFEVDESIVGSNLYNANGDLLKVMPRNYYTLTPENSVTIPQGSLRGLIEVHLEDDFFSDPEAVKGTYVIPLVATSCQEPASLLTGTAKEGVTSPSIHVATDWSVLPMNYTLFGVKYVNKFHGSWLRRGELVVRNAAGERVSTTTYHKEYVEWDEVVSLKTTAMSSFETTLNVGDENWTLEVTADDSDALSVTSSSSSAIKITGGTGSFAEGKETWGGTPENPTPRDAIYLDYFYQRADGSRCEVLDTLVFRDRGIVVETSRPIVK